MIIMEKEKENNQQQGYINDRLVQRYKEDEDDIEEKPHDEKEGHREMIDENKIKPQSKREKPVIVDSSDRGRTNQVQPNVSINTAAGRKLESNFA